MDIIKIKYQKVLDDIKKIYYFNNIIYLKKYNILFSNILKIKNFNILNYKFIRKKFIINNFIYIKMNMKKKYRIIECDDFSGKYNQYSSDDIDIGIYDNNNYRYFEYNFLYICNIFINNKLNYNIELKFKYKDEDEDNNLLDDFYLTKSLNFYILFKIFYKPYYINYNIINKIYYNYSYDKIPNYINNIYYRDYNNRRRNNNYKNLDIDLLIKNKIKLNIEKICYNTYINFYNDYIYCNIYKKNHKITSKTFDIKKNINIYDKKYYSDSNYDSFLRLFYVFFIYKKFKIYLNIVHAYLKYDENYNYNPINNFSYNCYKVYMENKIKIKFNLNNKLIKILI